MPERSQGRRDVNNPPRSANSREKPDKPCANSDATQAADESAARTDAQSARNPEDSPSAASPALFARLRRQRLRIDAIFRQVSGQVSIPARTRADAMPRANAR
ncbi:hypothetical protein PRJ39_08175 [Lysobacter enzymogenes]|uniref:hypothetical protein n=1 Tax=Lysobacter enzymogenes TaxID=69 RepID=UPI0037482898